MAATTANSNKLAAISLYLPSNGCTRIFIVNLSCTQPSFRNHLSQLHTFNDILRNVDEQWINPRPANHYLVLYEGGNISHADRGFFNGLLNLEFFLSHEPNAPFH